MKNIGYKGRPAWRIVILSLLAIVLAGLAWLGITVWQGLDLGANLGVVPGAVKVLPELRDLLGFNRPQTYLLMAQNNDELRATGGFITAIGLVGIDHARLSRFDFQDSYSVDNFNKNYPTPPQPLQRFMLASQWLTRDANWSPDFPTAARQVQDLYQLSTDIPTDGVIAFDQTAVQALLEVVGPLKLPDFPDAVTAQNVEDYMHQAWAPEPDQGFSQTWWKNRKNFIPQLGKLLLQKINATRSPATLLALARQGLVLLRSGHLAVYFSSPPAQAAFAKTGLDGSVSPGSGDFLELIDTNVGFNKTDAVVTRSLDYSVDLSDPAHPKANLLIHYQHTITQDVPCHQQAKYSMSYLGMQARCYWDYWRVYTEASTLTGSQVDNVSRDWLLNKQNWDGTLDEGNGESGTHVIGGLLVLPTNQARDVKLQFDLPASVVKNTSRGLTYSLRLQKQAGLKTLAATLHIISPVGWTLSNHLPGWIMANDRKTWTWQGDLTQGQDFQLVFSRH
jgi:hypothetical protein